MKKFLKHFLIIIISVVAALLLAEGMSRVLFDPINFLKPVTKSDEVLRYKIEPGSGAHDEWGFRNKSVPDTVEIVTVGDSQTYGISAQARDSWPSQLEKISGKPVYNLSLPGYGPAEYTLLMKSKAFSLKPKFIVAGLYLGNDLKDSFTAVYTVPVWEELRSPEFAGAKEDELPLEKKESKSLTDHLSENSVIYRLVSSSVVGDNLRHQRRIAKGENIVMLEDDTHGITTGLTPDRRLKGLSLDNAEITEGLNITLEFLNQMNEAVRENDAQFLVVLIPTKESVFSESIKANQSIDSKDELLRLLEYEKKANETIKEYLNEHYVHYVDTLPELRKASLKEQIYPSNFGGHPNKNGYRVIAETVNKTLKNLSSDK